MAHPLTPVHIYFKSSSLLTQQQLDTLTSFIHEKLFVDENLDDVPEWTTEVKQYNTQTSFYTFSEWG